MSGKTVLFFIFFFIALDENTSYLIPIAGYKPGLSGMGNIDPITCLNDELLADPSLSNPLQCARTCKTGQSKTCYYQFLIERYPVNGAACDLCMPNVTNTLCPNCQCVPGDGRQRMALTVNRMMTGPTIQVCKGDLVVIDVINRLQTESVTIHWHGIFQKGSPFYDGVPNLTQCPIQTPNQFRYQYYVDNSGTHFWHAHTGTQKLDGIFGSLIVRDTAIEEVHAHLYDYDLANHVIVINDWFNEESTERIPGRRAGRTGQTPDNFLINGKGRFIDPTGATTNIPFEVITVDPNYRYRFRSINSFCGICNGQLTIEGHNLTVIAIDGKPIEPVTANSIVSFAGERYDFIINTTKKRASYWIQLRAITNCASNRIQQLAVLQYSGASTVPPTPQPTYENPIPAGIVMDLTSNNCTDPNYNGVCYNDVHNAQYVDIGLLGEPDVKFHFSINTINYEPEYLYTPNTYNHFFVVTPTITVADAVSNISSVTPPVPLLTQLDDVPKNTLCNTHNLPDNCNSTACTCVHLVKVPLNSVVEVDMIDEFGAPLIRHPFHLHGFAYNVMGVGQPLGPTTSNSTKMTIEYFKQLDNNYEIPRNLLNPPGKDTIAVPNNGYAIFRFRANNPGFWLFHCHIIFHNVGGMELIFQVGEVTDLPKTPKYFPRCGNYKPKVINERKKYDIE